MADRHRATLRFWDFQEDDLLLTVCALLCANVYGACRDGKGMEDRDNEESLEAETEEYSSPPTREKSDDSIVHTDEVHIRFKLRVSKVKFAREVVSIIDDIESTNTWSFGLDLEDFDPNTLDEDPIENPYRSRH